MPGANESTSMTLLEIPLDSAPQFFFSLSLSEPSSARMEQAWNAATRLMSGENRGER